jgi:DMSO reductase anchor subunit
MLVLTQASTGAYAAEFALRAAGASVPTALPLLALAFGLSGLAASTLHLGRPLYAYRALIGLRHSWLSREVAAFGAFAAAALLGTAAPWLPFDVPKQVLTALAGAAAVTGLVGVACSVMVYHAVRRPFWHASQGGPKFLGTAAVLGLAAALASGSAAVGVLVPALIASALAKLAFETSILTHLGDPRRSMLRRSAMLLVGPLRRATAARLLLGLAGGVTLPLAVGLSGGGWPGTALAAAALAVTAAGELAERSLFFTAVVRPKMPGGVS